MYKGDRRSEFFYRRLDRVLGLERIHCAVQEPHLVPEGVAFDLLVMPGVTKQFVAVVFQ